MDVTAYRRVLRTPGVGALMAIAVLARIPVTAAPVVLTLHVVLDLGLGFARAGVLAAVFAVGTAVGSPLVGRGIDRFGLRPVLVVTTVVDAGFWSASPVLGYGGLLAAGLLGGLASLPVFSVTRQALTSMLPATLRQPGYAVDAMSVEVSYAVGPAAGIALLTATAATPTLLVIAASTAAAGIALVVLDPPVAAAADGAVGGARGAAREPAVPVRRWLDARVGAVLLATFATTFVLVGTDTALTATMRSFGEVSRLGVVVAVWCLASLAGGFVYGASRRAVPPAALLAVLAALCVPVALAGSWWALALLVVPTGACCAPMVSLTAQRVTALTPGSVRGLAVGVHASALTAGNAVGAPLTGLVVDAGDPRWGFVAVAAVGLALAGLTAAVSRGHGAGGPGRGGGRADRLADDTAAAGVGVLSA